ncbi:MAG: MATE family efflux transporter [bacterium]|jgi:putative MATE family efflux protein|nr:MATE family efflux transporter [bacterium]
MKEKILQGNILSAVFRISWPMMLGMFLHISMNLIDTIWVGIVGPLAVAAVSMSFTVVVVLFTFCGGVSIGVSSLIARAWGAADRGQAARVTEHALFLAFLFTAVITLGVNLAIEPMLVFLGAKTEFFAMAVSYLRVIMTWSVTIFLMFAFGSIFRALGDTITPCKAMCISSLTNLVLDPLLIFGFDQNPLFGMLGLGGVEEQLFAATGYAGSGVTGAAIATVISRGVGIIYYAWRFFRKDFPLKLNFEDFKYQYGIVVGIFKVGLPSTVARLTISTSFAFLMKAVSRFGSFAIAAYGICMKVDALIFLPMMGASMAIITMTGQNVGAGQPERARKIVATAIRWLVCLGTTAGAAVWFFPAPIMTIFTREPEVISVGVEIFKWLSLLYGAIAVAMITGAGFQGAGDAKPVLAMAVTRNWLITVPAAYLVSRFYGLRGIWWSIAAGILIEAVMALLYLKFYHFKPFKRDQGE